MKDSGREYSRAELQAICAASEQMANAVTNLLRTKDHGLANSKFSIADWDELRVALKHWQRAVRCGSKVNGPTDEELIEIAALFGGFSYKQAEFAKSIVREWGELPEAMREKLMILWRGR